MPLCSLAGRAARSAQEVNQAQRVVANANNYRSVFQRTYGEVGPNMQVHHTLPQKYNSLFEKVGVNIHDPKYLQAVPKDIHVKITNAWKQWEKSMDGKVNTQSIKDFAKQIDKQFGKYYKQK